MVLDVLLLALGLGLLVAGGRAFVDGSSRLAESLGVSELAIGLTVVAFGTSAPELALNVLAAVRGDSAIAFGNIVGSNIANAALVIGLAAMVRPLLIESAIVSREIPMMLLATFAALILGLDGLRAEPEVYDFSDGLMFLLLFSVFLYYTISEVVAKRRTDTLAEVATERVHSKGLRTVGKSSLLIAMGLGTLLIGAQLTVMGAVSVAEALEVPEAIIGLTIVAVGTSLPELTTSVIAARNGQTSLAVGNVVGSNIFNLLFILGTTALIRPVEVPEPGGNIDLFAMAAFSAVLLPLSRVFGFRIVRGEGLGLVVAYFAYMIWRVAG